MWIFGYGSLMWDGWEATFDCKRKERAVLKGYARSFTKASVKNWGSKTAPGPDASCYCRRGIRLPWRGVRVRG